MNTEEKALTRILFQREVLRANGQAYEDLFVRIMQYANPNFIPIKPHGNVGDRKNDGYDNKMGRYYQVFAPENPNANVAAAVRKAKTDFRGLKKYWDKLSRINEYYFTFNDKYQGPYPEIEAVLKVIRKDHGLSDCRCFLAKDLEEILLHLSDDQIKSIVGFLPDPSRIQLLDFSILNELISHILRGRDPLDLRQLLSAPDLEEKIIFNDLSPEVGALLKKGSYHVGLIDKYFSRNSNFTKQELRDHVNDIYLQIQTKTPVAKSKQSSRSDLMFFDILNEMLPTRTHPAQDAALQDAALVVMAYFFETCDVFEDPKPS